MNEKETDALTEGVSQDFSRMHQEAEDIKEILTIRKQLEPVLPYISIANFAKKYFGKTSSWFYQRLNGNIVHGKRATFTSEEIKTLNEGLKDLCNRLGSIKVSL